MQQISRKTVCWLVTICWQTTARWENGLSFLLCYRKAAIHRIVLLDSSNQQRQGQRRHKSKNKGGHPFPSFFNHPSSFFFLFRLPPFSLFLSLSHLFPSPFLLSYPPFSPMSPFLFFLSTEFFYPLLPSFVTFLPPLGINCLKSVLEHVWCCKRLQWSSGQSHDCKCFV